MSDLFNYRPEESKIPWPAVIVVVVISLVILAFWAQRSESMLLRDLHIEGNYRVSEEQVRAAGDLNRVRNILSLQEEEIVSGIERLAWVKGVEYQQGSYNALSLVIEEWQPIAAALYGDRQIWINEQGMPVEAASLNSDDLEMPLLLGAIEEGDDGRLLLLADRVEVFIELRELWGQVEDRLGTIDTVHLYDAGWLEVITDAPLSIVLRRDNLSERLSTAGRAAEYAVEQQRNFARLSVDRHNYRTADLTLDWPERGGQE